MDVAHTCYALVRRARKLRRAYLSRLHLFCLMVAALAHDMGHQGVSGEDDGWHGVFGERRWSGWSGWVQRRMA